MLKIYLSLMMFIFFISANDNILLLDELKKNEGWSLIENRLDSIRVYEKHIQKMSLKALKVEKIIDFDYEIIFNTVMDIGNYPTIMSSPDMLSFILGQKEEFIYAYNHFPIPFPFIEDRHYFFKIKKVSNKELNWTLLSPSEIDSIYKFK